MKQASEKVLAASLSIVALLAFGVVLKVMAGVFTQVTIAVFAMFLVNPAVSRAARMIDGLLRMLKPKTRMGRPFPGVRGESHAAGVMGSVIVVLLALTLVAFSLLILYGTGNMLMERRAELVANVVQPVGEFVNGVQNHWLPGLYRSLGMEGALEAMPPDTISIIAAPVKTGPGRSTMEAAIGNISLTSLVPTAANVLGTLTQLFLKIAIITMLTVFLLSGRREFSGKLLALDPEKHHRISKLIAGVEGVPRKYLIAKLTTSLLTGVLIGAGLLIWMAPGDAFIWGFIAMVMNFIPFFGSLIAAILIVLYTLSVGGNSGLWTILLVVVVNNLVSNVIEPTYFGRVLPVGKVTVLICVLVWGFLWGLTGVFLAVPITIMLKELIEQVYGRNAFTVAMEV
jgi:predicted PurR-regulated permease PerM